jgi:predicted nucleic acid-binding protein
VTAGNTPVVVDANIIFSALLRRGNRFYTVLQEGGRFVVSETILTEIFRHKEKMVAAARVGADEMAEAYHALLALLEIQKERRVRSRAHAGSRPWNSVMVSIPTTPLLSP